MDFRLALNLADLPRGWLFVRGIARPDTSTYTSFTEAVSQSQGGQTQHGFANVRISWTNADSKTTKFIKTLIGNALTTNRVIYATIPVNDGSKGGRQWVDVSGTPHPIQVREAGDFTHYGVAYTDLQLFINNLTIINDPATV